MPMMIHPSRMVSTTHFIMLSTTSSHECNEKPHETNNNSDGHASVEETHFSVVVIMITHMSPLIRGDISDSTCRVVCYGSFYLITLIECLYRSTNCFPDAERQQIQNAMPDSTAN